MQHDLALANFVSLTFNNQKNGVKGESIGHGASGHPTTCCVCALHQRVEALQAQGATATTPIAHVKEQG